MAESSLDLGLVNLLPGDDVPPHLAAHELLQGRPVVCLPADHPLAGLEAVTVDQLREEPFITMRAGYLMHRFVHRLFAGRLPATSFATDGAEMGKLMVAEGLGRDGAARTTAWSATRCAPPAWSPSGRSPTTTPRCGC